MSDLSYFLQSRYPARFEWGENGVRLLAPVSDIVIVIDVLSFTTCVELAVSRSAVVYPFRHGDPTAATFARQVNAQLAGKRGDEYSLSPAAMSHLPNKTRLVLPSMNGAQCSRAAAETDATVLAGCLRNASAVGQYICKRSGVVSVIASGERWPDGSIRHSFEDLIAAGAILSHLDADRLSPEAASAVAAFESVRSKLPSVLNECGSGRELIEQGFASDVTIAGELDASTTIPILNEERAYVAHTANGSFHATHSCFQKEVGQVFDTYK